MVCGLRTEPYFFLFAGKHSSPFSFRIIKMSPTERAALDQDRRVRIQITKMPSDGGGVELVTVQALKDIIGCHTALQWHLKNRLKETEKRLHYLLQRLDSANTQPATETSVPARQRQSSSGRSATTKRKSAAKRVPDAPEKAVKRRRPSDEKK